MVMPYHLHMPSYFLETFTEYPYLSLENSSVGERPAPRGGTTRPDERKITII